MKLTQFFFVSAIMILNLFAPGGTSLAGDPSASDTLEPMRATTPRTTVLPNGLTVVVKKDTRFPLVSMRLLVRAGSAYEVDRDAGLSHVLEHMAFKGTDNRPKGTVSSDIEKNGGNFNAYTSYDRTVYLVDSLKSHWKEGLDVLKDMTSYLTLDQAELESEKEVVIAELRRNKDNPSRRVYELIQTAMFEGTAYRHPIIGTEETIRAMTPESLRAYIDRYYQPQSMILVVCGDIDEAEVIDEAIRLFGEMGNTALFEEPALIQVPRRGFTVKTERGPWKKVTLSVAVPGLPFQDFRSAQLDVLAQILGGDAASRFPLTYKYDKRLVDSISVWNSGMERGGIFYITATLDADKLKPFWEMLVRDLAALPQTTFSPEELDRAKLNLETDFYHSQETLASSAEHIMAFEFLSSGVAGEQNYLRALRATDQAVLSQLVGELFQPDSIYLAVVMPEETSEEEPIQDFAEWSRQTLGTHWTALGTPSSTVSAKGVLPLEDIDLGNGRRVILQYDDSVPFVSAQLSFYGGNSLLQQKDQGLAAFTASLLTRGTKALNATAFKEFQSDRASQFSASTGLQSFTLSFDTPSRYLQDMFGLLHEVVSSPALNDEEADRTRQDQLAAIVKTEDDAMGLVRRKMYSFLLGDHPYGYVSLGFPDRVAGFTPKDASSFWNDQTRYPWVLSVCGAFDREAVLQAARKLPTPRTTPSLFPAVTWQKDHLLDLSLKDRQQAHLFMVFPTAPIGSPDEPALDLLQSTLAGMSGLLFRDLRDDQGLGYTVTAYPWKTQKAGALIFYIGTDPQTLEDAENGFGRIIADLHTELLAEEDLDRGKNVLLGQYYRSQQTIYARASEAATLALLGLPLDAHRQAVEKTQSVTSEEIRNVVRKYLNLESAYIIKVHP